MELTWVNNLQSAKSFKINHGHHVDSSGCYEAQVRLQIPRSWRARIVTGPHTLQLRASWCGWDWSSWRQSPELPGSISSQNDKQPTVQVGTNGLHIGKFTNDLWTSECFFTSLRSSALGPPTYSGKVGSTLQDCTPEVGKPQSIRVLVVFLNNANIICQQGQMINAWHFVFDLLRPVGTGPPGDLGHIPLEQSCNREKRRCDPARKITGGISNWPKKHLRFQWTATAMLHLLREAIAIHIEDAVQTVGAVELLTGFRQNRTQRSQATDFKILGSPQTLKNRTFA